MNSLFSNSLFLVHSEVYRCGHSPSDGSDKDDPLDEGTTRMHDRPLVREGCRGRKREEDEYVLNGIQTRGNKPEDGETKPNLLHGRLFIKFPCQDEREGEGKQGIGHHEPIIQRLGDTIGVEVGH